MLISILGAFGSGKTLLLCIFAVMSTREVHSNFVLNMAKYRELTTLSLMDLKDNIEVFIDEGYTWLESRISSSNLNRYLSYIILQSRKRTIDIYITAQLFSTIDLRFRENSDVIIKCLRKTSGFKYSFLNIRNRTIKSYFLSFKDAEEYYKLYDTYEIIEPHDKKALEFSLLLDNPIELDKRVIEISNNISSNLKKITHDSINRALINNKYNIKFEKYVYMYLKG